MSTPAYILKLRNDFPALHQEVNGRPLVYLDNGATSQKPISVLQSMDQYYRTINANVHRGVHHLSQEATHAFEFARQSIASYFHVEDQDEIIFTRGTTEGINIIAAGFEKEILQPGDEVLITAMEHHSNIVPWQMACQRTGAALKVVPVLDDGSLNMEEFHSLINEKTRIVAVVHISNALGTINRVEEIIEKAHSMDIPVLVDGAQSVAHMRMDLQSLNSDFFVCSGHKMLGPTGIGVLHGKREWLEKLPPYQGGGDMIKTVTFEKTTYNQIPFKFEAGTPSIAEAIGLGAAVEYLNKLNYHEIEAHEKALLTKATEAIRSFPELRIIGEVSEKASVVSFVGHQIHPFDLGTLLDKQGVAVRTGHHCTQPLMDRFGIPGTARASFAFYNTLEEVNALHAALERAIKMLK